MAGKLEDIIKTSNFRNVYQKTVLNVFVTSNWISDQHQEIFKKYDLTIQQYNVLRILRGQYPKVCNLHNIRDRMLDKMSDVSRIIERLRKSNLVDRVVNEDDRRSVDIKITDKGLDLLKTMQKEESTMDNLLSNLTEEEAVNLNNLLDKIRT